MQFNKFKRFIIAALAVAMTAAVAAPASAATYYTVRYTYTYSYKPVTYKWYTWTSAPKTTTTKTTTTVKQPATTQQTTTKPTTTTPATTTTKTNTTASTAGLTAAEQQMLNLVNQERAKAGLQPLKADLELTKLARLKSQDMINKNYFDHNSPTYGSPFQMMKQFGITYKTAGENIAGNQTVERAHTALMNSAGHRANILNPNYTHIGIGIQNGGNYGMMFTQMFVGR